MLWIILPLLFTLYVVYRFMSFSGKYSLPPGPLKWPLVGNAFTVNTSRCRVFTDLAKKYGGIFSLNLFGRRYVVISNVEAVQNFKHGETFDRHHTFVERFLSEKHTAPYKEESKKWESRRHLLSKRINIYTGGIQLSESALRHELGNVVEWIDSHKGEPVDLSPILLASVINTTAILLHGKRFQLSGDEIKAAYDVINRRNQLTEIKVDSILRTLPCLAKFPLFYGSAIKQLRKDFDNVTEDFYTKPKSSSRGLLDLLLKTKEGNNNNNNDPSVGTNLSDDDVREITCDIATNHATKVHSALMNFLWIVLYKPAVALKIQREVEKVTNSTRPPSLRDRERMPYTEAAILESLRFCPPVRFLQNYTKTELKIEEYRVPEDTTVLIDLVCVNKDPNVWVDADKFMPERFLTDTGKLLPESNPLRRNLAVFGLSKQKCVGQSFALSRIFLYVLTLLQQFNFRQPVESDSTNPEESMTFTGLVSKPDPFKVKVFRHQYKLDYYTHGNSTP